MNSKSIKQIAILAVLILFTVPFLIKFLAWTTSATLDPSPENIQKGAELIAEDAIPWWLDIVVWLSGFGIIGAILIIGLFKFLKWIGEIS